MNFSGSRHKTVSGLLFFITMMVGQAAWASECYNTRTSTINSGTPGRYVKSLDLSDAFVSNTSYSLSFSSAWNHALSCDIGTWNIYFKTPISTPFYVHFTDDSGKDDYWIKLTATVSPVSASTGRITTALQQVSMGSFPTTISFTADLVADPGSAVDYTETTTGTAKVMVATAMKGNYTYSDSEIRQLMMEELTSGSYAYGSLTYAIQYVNITYIPQTMTCDVGTQTIKMPAVGLNDLLTGKDDGEKTVSLPVDCQSSTGNAISNVSAWLSSNDIVDSENKVIRNDESTSTGIGIKLKTTQGSDIVFSSSSSRGNATEVMSLSKGDALGQASQQLNLTPYYSVYDASAVQPGTVTATATVMFGYD